jgi:long-chain acyl-CoA synthetase
LGRFDRDGYLHIVGRAKEVIVLADGKNVTPDVVEAAYATSPLIKEIAVLEHKGHLAALVVPDVEGLRASGTSRADQAIRMALAEVAQGLPSFQRLSGFAVVKDALPKTRLGKYKRGELPEIYRRALQGEAAPRKAKADMSRVAQSERARAVLAWLEARYPDKTLAPDSVLQLDLGVDSLAWVELGLEMERRFGVHLPEEAVAKIVTLEDLLRVLDTAPAGAAAPQVSDEQWLAEPGPLHRALGFVLFAVTWILVRLYLRLRVMGRDGTAAEGRTGSLRRQPHQRLGWLRVGDRLALVAPATDLVWRRYHAPLPHTAPPPPVPRIQDLPGG